MAADEMATSTTKLTHPIRLARSFRSSFITQPRLELGTELASAPPPEARAPSLHARGAGSLRDLLSVGSVAGHGE